MTSFRIRSLIAPYSEYAVSAFILPHLTVKIPAESIAVASWQHLQDIPFADPSSAVPGSIDIILGADVYGALLHDF